MMNGPTNIKFPNESYNKAQSTYTKLMNKLL